MCGLITYPYQNKISMQLQEFPAPYIKWILEWVFGGGGGGGGKELNEPFGSGLMLHLQRNKIRKRRTGLISWPQTPLVGLCTFGACTRAFGTGAQKLEFFN